MQSEVDRRYDEASARIETRVEAMCRLVCGHADVDVIYSAYDTDDDDVPIDNLDKVSVRGKVVVISKRDEFHGGPDSGNYQSPVLLNPTWLQLCAIANAAIQMTNDHHHVFLEGVERVTKAKKQQDKIEIKIYELVFGS